MYMDPFVIHIQCLMLQETAEQFQNIHVIEIGGTILFLLYPCMKTKFPLRKWNTGNPS